MSNLWRIMAITALLDGYGAVVTAQVDATTPASTATQPSTTTAIILNLLRSPASPAANLLGTLPSDIHQPTDVTSFAVSLQNATNGFSGIPANFAVDVAPFWLFGNRGRNLSFTDYQGNKQSFWERLVLSAAVKGNKNQSGADSSVQIGTGLRFSILRGKIDPEAVSKIQAYLNKRVNFRDSLQDKLERENSTLLLLTEQIKALGLKPSKNPEELKLEAVLSVTRLAIVQQIKETVSTKADEKLADELKDIERSPLRRYGIKIDLTSGLAWDFKDSRFNDGKIFRTGFWFTGGYEAKSGHAFLGIVRLLYNPNTVFADDKKTLITTDVTTFDAGAKYSFTSANNPFTASTEFIYRSVLDQSQLPSSWRWTANLNYEVAKNTVLTLALGRDFDRTFTKDGNVIAFLNFITGFGSTRRIN